MFSKWAKQMLVCAGLMSLLVARVWAAEAEEMVWSALQEAIEKGVVKAGEKESASDSVKKSIWTDPTAPFTRPKVVVPVVNESGETLMIEQTVEAKMKEPEGLKVKEILYSKQRRVAVIDGKIVQEGDAVNDAIVAKIEYDRVYLDFDGEEKILMLFTPLK